MRRVLITGSRTWDDWRTIEVALREEWYAANWGGVTVVHGGARGADLTADYLAKRMGLVVESHPARWDLLGKRAGYVRNQHMVDLGADVCLAFIKDQSRGAMMCARIAEAAGIPVRRWTA